MLFVLDRCVFVGVLPGVFGEVFGVFLFFGGGAGVGFFVYEQFHALRAEIHWSSFEMVNRRMAMVMSRPTHNKSEVKRISHIRI